MAASQSMNDIFDKSTSVTWLGLDLSQAKLIGDREKYGSSSDVKYLMEAWNNLIINEPEKFDIAGAIHKSKVENAIEATKNRNTEVDPAEMFSDKSADHMHLKPSDVEEIVSSYDFGTLSGIGLMFVVESFNKINEQGSAYVTFINLDSREVMFTERLTAPPRGFGMRNYWAGSVYEMLNKMKKKEFEMWRKKYMR
jgi:hypothetical protein